MNATGACAADALSERQKTGVILRGNVVSLDRIHARSRWAALQPRMQCGKRRGIATGDHFDATISEVSSSACNAECTRPLRRRCTKANALDTTLDEKTQTRHLRATSLHLRRARTRDRHA